MTTLSIINEERKRREFLYHLYRRVTGHNYFGWPDGTFANNVYKDMERNWGRSEVMPILRYHIDERNIYCKGYSDKECQDILANWDSLESYRRFPSLHITHKGMIAVETDHDLLKCVVNDETAVDWNLADRQGQKSATGEQHWITPEQVDSIIFSAIVRHGYKPQNVGDKYAVFFEERELGYVWAIRGIKGRYFLYQATHKQGEGELYEPRKAQDGFQRIDEDMVRFIHLLELIDKEVKQQIEANNMVDLWTAPEPADGQGQNNGQMTSTNEEEREASEEKIDLTDDDFVEIGHSRVIEPNIIWAERPKVGQYPPASIIQYHGDIRDAVNFLLVPAEKQLNIRLAYEEHNYRVERELAGDGLLQRMLAQGTGYALSYDLHLRSTSEEKPTVRECGAILLRPLSEAIPARTEVIVMSWEPAVFYHEWIDEYCIIRGIEGRFSTKQGQSDTADASSTKPQLPQATTVNIDVIEELAKQWGQIKLTETTSMTAIPAAKAALEAIKQVKYEQETANASPANNEIDEASYLPEIYDIKLMKGFYSGYNVETAKTIIDGLIAYESCVNNGENWTITYLANGVGMVRETTSRYINAFKKAGLTKIRGVPLP